LERKQAASPQPKKSLMMKSQIKTILISFFDIKDIVHFEFISQGKTINQAYHMEILKRLREAVHRKRPEI
jgi:hypothetical protein